MDDIYSMPPVYFFGVYFVLVNSNKWEGIFDTLSILVRNKSPPYLTRTSTSRFGFDWHGRRPPS